MVKDNQHLIVKNYLNKHSLVESNITSYNNFIEQRLQEIVNDISENMVSDDFEITLGKVEVGRPRVIEADGSSSIITPTEARLRNLTYSAPIKMELTVKKDDQVDSEIVEIGKIPVMVKSNICNTRGMSKEELINNYIDPLDPGGYFIINGNERVMVMAEDLAENQPFIEKDKKGNLILRVFSLRGTYRIPTVISENKEGIFEISF
jgi:DNA-directed RNA polymerase beta subunit